VVGERPRRARRRRILLIRTRNAHLAIVVALVVGCDGLLKHGELLDRRAPPRTPWEEPGGASGAGSETGAAGQGVGAAGGVVVGGATSGGSGEAGGSVGGTGGTRSHAGEGGDGGGIDAGASGEGGSGSTPPDTSVSGRVIDFWNQPVPDVSVSIGTATAMTDADGRFTLPDVAPEYDVSLVLALTDAYEGTYAWRYEGVTRRNPTLQVGRGRNMNFGYLRILEPTTSSWNPSRTMSLAVAGPGDARHMSLLELQNLPTLMPVSWTTPLTSAGITCEGLLWERDANGLPTAYAGYESTQVNPNLFSPAELALNLHDQALPSGFVSGTVDSQHVSGRNAVFVRFSSGAAMPIVSEGAPDAVFEYLVPTLLGATITVSAVRWDDDGRSESLVHRDSLQAGTNDVRLNPPPWAVPTEPPDLTEDVGVGTTFAWDFDGPERVFLLHVQNEANPYRQIYVVTPRKRTTLPSFSGFALERGAEHTWHVETHGDVASTDAATSPGGFLDSFAWSGRAARGAWRRIDYLL
jgi:hypothetical protein